MKLIVKVRLKDGILDPQGKAVNTALHHLGYQQIRNVRIGKLIELEIDEPDPQKARQIVDEASHKLLTNPIIENYQIEIGEDEK
ncbi:MAG: phosphoribosylformylglycinamidine synthase subunit PurS [Calditrichia bacterium]